MVGVDGFRVSEWARVFIGDVVKALWDLVKVISGCVITDVGWLKERG